MKNIPIIQVGILNAEIIHFKLNGTFQFLGQNFQDVEGEAKILGNNSFSIKIGEFEQKFDEDIIIQSANGETDNFDLYDVIIGLEFHWERAINQRFKGNLRLYVEDGKLNAVNIIDLEEYLLSVISSEMSATSSLELLKAHAVMSRSWLIAQIEKSKKVNAADYTSTQEIEGGYLRWYDRENHDKFDVCADDHCQRYQGISMISSEYVVEALKNTRGKVLVYNDKVCDARYYKACGGMTDLFENTWEPINHPYLSPIVDNSETPEGYNMDLTVEENARIWIENSPEAFCNTHDTEILSQVLNNYDQETTDFYRWMVELLQDEIKQLLKDKINVDVGDIIDLIPVERGPSARLIRLKIKGSENEITIGKELEIRKAFSKSHLYSSAFVVDKVYDKDNPSSPPQYFILKGAGWGHGVGLCQIGAAMMGVKGYSYKEILAHYFPSADIKVIY